MFLGKFEQSLAKDVINKIRNNSKKSVEPKENFLKA